MSRVIRKSCRGDRLRTTTHDPWLFLPFLIIPVSVLCRFSFSADCSFFLSPWREGRATSNSTTHIFQFFHLRVGVFSAFQFKYLYERTLTDLLFRSFTQSLILWFGKWECVWSSVVQVPTLVQILSSAKQNHMGRGWWCSLSRLP